VSTCLTEDASGFAPKHVPVPDNISSFDRPVSYIILHFERDGAAQAKISGLTGLTDEMRERFSINGIKEPTHTV